ncbi:MAG: glycosyl hydrolase [Saprospiraceae bacterium]|nr:glycosyl hydrolase [Candidatus Vicinibacter affinis]MBP6174367.1 glycosyl hydrolase [Saprospiraceae bacterium]
MLITFNFMAKKCLQVLILMAFISIVNAQDSNPPSRLQALQQRQKISATSLSHQIPIRNIGPTVFGGRVVDIEANPDRPEEFYVAFASGGLWHTNNNGASFSPLFDHEAVMTIGDLAIDWPRKIIYLGTGENNSSRSSYAGCGIYKSYDLGKTWIHLGLEETQHIGKIILDPGDTNRVYVAALGHLYSENPDRGLYTSSDAGRTWKRNLFINDSTGIIDLVMDPLDPSILYASSWTRTRRAWNLNESGQGSGIYKTNDYGLHWKLLTDSSSGFPHGAFVGRIGLSIYHAGTQQIIYALLDNHERRPADSEKKIGLHKDVFKKMTKEEFLKIKDDSLEIFLRDKNFDADYTAASVKKLIRQDKILPAHLAEYLEDGNSRLFDTPIKGGELYASTDAGKTWHKTHEGFLDGIYFTYGYYFGQVRLNPKNPQHVILLGYPLISSADGGKTFHSIENDNQHVDHHALWINPANPFHMINGNDGGINITYDGGNNWLRCTHPPVGQFYSINYDLEEDYHVYGGAQDNGVWKGPSGNKISNGWQLYGKYPHEVLLGGDGMQTEVDPTDSKIIYTGFQFGNYFRIDKNFGTTSRITPKHKLGERPYRWNWQTPILLSSHNSDILYMGSNFLHRSMNQGRKFEIISPDLTKGNTQGDVPFGTITTISESKLKFGLLYTGSDDGEVYVSKDGGDNWNKINEGIPQDKYVSKILASTHVKQKVYLCLNNYRRDDFESMLYVSENYGANWKRIGMNLPAEPLNVVCEDPEHPNLLYAGSDHGVYYSLDNGINFSLLSEQLPFVPIHDLKVHPKAKELIIGTHGRSVFIADVSVLQQLSDSNLQKEIMLFEPDEIKFNNDWGKKKNVYTPADSLQIPLSVYSKSSGEAEVKIMFQNITLNKKKWMLTRGINQLQLDGHIESSSIANFLKEYKKENKEYRFPETDDKKNYLPKGLYKIKINKAGISEEKNLKIK